MNNIIATIRELERLAPRRFDNEKLARGLIKRKLTSYGVDFQTQPFNNHLPQFTGFRLTADGETIECMPTAFRSGEIEGKPLISSMSVSGRYYEWPNINFNPYSDVFSLATFYRAPSLAIKRKDVQRIVDAEIVEGRVKMTKKPHRCENIIAGNTKNPRNVLIAHTDSVLSGALDNASGTALLLELTKKGAKENMFVFSGCEELSFDEPIYWGRGYRILEQQFRRTMAASRRVIVVDMVGSSSPTLITDKTIRLAAFPIKDQKLFERSCILSVGGHEWMPVYHSNSDKTDLIKERYLDETMAFARQLMIG